MCSELADQGQVRIRATETFILSTLLPEDCVQNQMADWICPVGHSLLTPHIDRKKETTEKRLRGERSFSFPGLVSAHLEVFVHP